MRKKYCRVVYTPYTIVLKNIQEPCTLVRHQPVYTVNIIFVLNDYAITKAAAAAAAAANRQQQIR